MPRPNPRASGRRPAHPATALVALAGLVLPGAPARAQAQAAGPAPAARTVEGTFPAGDISLGFRIDFPAGPGPFPVVVISHGSGPATRSREGYALQPLLERGVAVFRYDKRGAVPGAGAWVEMYFANSESRMPELISDLAMAVRFLGGRPDAAVDPERIGVMGASQAGWLIPAVARRSSGVSFAIVLVGPAVTVGQENWYSRLAEDPAQSVEALDARLDELPLDRGWAHGFDPAPAIAGIDVPTLWLLGARDRSLPAARSAEILRALQARHGLPLTLLLYPRATHRLEDAETGEKMPIWDDIDRWAQRTGLAARFFPRLAVTAE